MKNNLLKRRAASIAAAAMMTVSAAVGTAASSMPVIYAGSSLTAYAAESSVKILSSAGFGEGMYATWSSVSGAGGYNVYVDGVQIDTMLVRQYSGYMRADAVGLKAGSHTMRVVPVIGGKEDGSKAAEATATAYAHDRSGFGFVNGSSSGAYNNDGTLKSNAIVIYVTEGNKDTVSASIDSTGKGATAVTGVQNIITAYKKGKEPRPLNIRIIGNITDPSVLMKGDLMVDTVTAGCTIEGIGNDATLNGFGLVLKNCSNVEVRNLGFMNCNSSEGDNCGLQQNNNHIWVHNCDFFYGDAGSDADQAKGDGALDTKTSTYITHSYNHFWDNGKCNLQGMKSESTENYITYHHNWYDHSDSRHPRIRTCSVHCYNNYFDGNAKYGVGVTMGASCFVESNYFRNCKYPMLISLQGSDDLSGGTFSGEAGGVIKSYGNIMTGQKAYTTYQENSTDFDAYEASSKTEKIGASVKAKSGGTAYNNFDTSSVMYSYTADNAADVPAIVTAKAGRVDGGDFKWQFNNSVDDESYAVNQALKSALSSYKGSVTAIGSGFKEDNSAAPAVTTSTAPVINTQPAVTTISVTQPAKTTTSVPASVTPVTGANVIYASPNGGGDGKTLNTPTDVLTAIKSIPAGGTIYLLGGTYKYSSPIMIEESNAGKSGAYKTIAAYPNAAVKFDFSGEAVSGTNRGFVLDGSYWHFYGFEIANAGDNGMLLSGDNNIIEMMVFDNNQDTGLQISRYNASYTSVSQWPTNNLVKNCTSRNNCDDATMENADGFAAKLTCGEGNVFDGCIAYNNSDDGWDLYAKTETGPIGSVTIKNSIAFRNGFTENGRGYGDCDGNGFKLGGGGVGTRHTVENCLSFENLNCGFTDNNNPKFGDMKNCTAYNNGIGGNGKSNYMVYRCDTSAKFSGMMSYINTSKVSKTNAAGIKVSNDKFVGIMSDSVYYNSKYYYAKSGVTMTSGAKLGDIVTPADSDFISLSVAAMGTDFHKAWRNADGSPKPSGFAETASGSTYKSIGYHMSGGITQTATPNPYAAGTAPVQTSASSQQTTTTSSKPVQSTTTTVTSLVVSVSGGYIHNFTENGTQSSFYSITGNLSDAKGTVNYDGKTLTRCLKIETATAVSFNAPSAGRLTLVFTEPAATIKIDGTKYTSSGDGIISADLSAGAHTVAKADAANLFYMVFSPSSAQPVVTTTTTTAPVTTSPVTTFEPYNGKAGDANGDGEVELADAIFIMQSLANPDKYQIRPELRVNADVYERGGGITANDALAIQKYLLGLVPALPES
ncbi:MAG: right-handed parallel beta-helix repeat-containing protein [Ruminococcus sp.]|uniref:pectate lyase family protein n=1 Tax=Ruminococcus sp. TaxID=41978 RepID=UPI0025FAD8E5|nr:right-handed parallel beta-helix repeat-containing protein [Ruminococcus sp.]MBR6995569.1 right-handed parallel beta-helix repeat-containing protein [Ruminococcus sp.]